MSQLIQFNSHKIGKIIIKKGGNHKSNFLIVNVIFLRWLTHIHNQAAAVYKKLKQTPPIKNMWWSAHNGL